jgi:hypothetical protein
MLVCAGPAARAVRDDIERSAYPLKDWFETCLVQDKDGRVTSDDVRQSWDSWCRINRRENNYSTQSFWSELRQLAPNIKNMTVRVSSTTTKTGFAGIKFKIQDKTNTDKFESVTHILGADNQAQECKPEAHQPTTNYNKA